MQLIELDKIAGSVGRYQDFDRHFLPLKDSLKSRWVNIEAMTETAGWPPIEVYLVGGIYFVRDGNHRVAVARQLEMDTIEAHVWEFPQEVKISAADPLDAVLIRFEERRFLAESNLDQIRPGHTVRFTSPGRYSELRAQIAEMAEMLAVIDGEYPSDEEVVAAWYDLVYLPVVQIIRETALLKTFPGRTEADLFVWLSAHRQELMRRYGTHDHLSDLAAALAQKYQENPLKRWWRRLMLKLGYRKLPTLNSPGADKS